ncbi:MAG: amidohydrolase family protein [Proteobacteria bacterium]|nr:amidohydrolase family protein [Pseudomonadota bacterium]
MNTQPAPRGGPDPDTRVPSFKLPPGACDCHVHIYGPAAQFPFAPAQRDRAFEAPRDALEAMHNTLAVDRCVIVHGGTHGTDLSVTLDALASGGGRYRAVALVEPGITDARLEELHHAGVRAVRYGFVFSQPDEAVVRRMAERIAAFGWHMALFLRGDDIVARADLFRNLPVPLLFDHMAGIDPASGGIGQAAFRELARHLKDGAGWAKLSALENHSHQPYPFADATDLARALIDAAPDRVLWGTNWPHPDALPGGPVNDGDLVDLIPLYAPDRETQHKLLVENPAALYGFD